jgi:hypothetical protein
VCCSFQKMDEKVVSAHQVGVDSGSDQKIETHEIEGGSGLKTVEVGYAADQVLTELDEKEKTRILRKIDYRLVPILAVLYL